MPRLRLPNPISKRLAFVKSSYDVPGADPRLSILVEEFLDYWSENSLETRGAWLRRIRAAASQERFDFEPALRKFMVHILVGSKYSALASVRKTNYPRKNELTKIIEHVAKLIAQKAPENEFEESVRNADWNAGQARFAAERIFGASVDKSISGGEMDEETFHEGIAAAEVANYASSAARDAAKSFGRAPSANLADSVAVTASAAILAAAEAGVFVGGAQGCAAATDGARRDYAAALLYFIEQQAQGGNRRRANPSSEKVPTLESLLGVRKSSKRASRKVNPPRKSKSSAKPSPAKTLVSECHRLWEHYCERPNKTRLRAVIKHCELMAESPAKSVKEERARCMRAARREMKKLGMK